MFSYASTSALNEVTTLSQGLSALVAQAGLSNTPSLVTQVHKIQDYLTVTLNASLTSLASGTAAYLVNEATNLNAQISSSVTLSADVQTAISLLNDVVDVVECAMNMTSLVENALGLAVNLTTQVRC